MGDHGAGEERVDPGHAGERIDAATALMVIAAMPLWAREVLVLAALGHGGTEIAAILDIPLGTPEPVAADLADLGGGRALPKAVSPSTSGGIGRAPPRR
ncbi:hypothetical protein [Sorangium sp. So ce204]|uniref:hypothetical protein n=1 Tax=Sorangium sp. So ce204 TaxID=3133288 RepID=UPI003F5F2370